MAQQEPPPPPLALIHKTTQHLRRQRYLNVLGFFLPLGLALGLSGYLVLTTVSWPLALLLGPLGVWAFFFWTSLRQTQNSAGHQTAAALLDEKTLSKERFLTLATLSRPQEHTGLLPLLQRDTAKRAAFFVPERDVPFRLDRRVPIGLLVSGLCVAGAFGLFSLPSQTISALLSPTLGPSQKPLQLAELEKKAHELATQGNTPQERAAGAELIALVEQLRAPGLERHEKEHLIEETEKRIRLNIQLPQLLPIDLKLLATEGQNEQNDGTGGDQKQDLAKKEQSQGRKKRPAAAEGTEAGQQRRDDGPSEGDQNRQAEPPQQVGGGIQFEQPERRGEKKNQPGQQGEQRQTSSQHDPTQHSQGADPNIPGERQNQPDMNTPGPRSDPNLAGHKGQASGKGPSQRKAQRFIQAGEKLGGFLTKDVRFVKVRVPVGDESQSDTEKRTPNTSPAQPTTPHSNAPLTDRPRDPTQASQPIPLEYRPLLNTVDDDKADDDDQSTRREHCPLCDHLSKKRSSSTLNSRTG